MSAAVAIYMLVVFGPVIIVDAAIVVAVSRKK